MGTNYYVAKNVCECCKRYDEEFHIGKSSWGWAFSFRGFKYEKLESWKDWKEYLSQPNVIIVDEYREFIPVDKFINMIETFKSPNYVNPQTKHKNSSMFEAVKKTDGGYYYNPEYDWEDEEGYSFSSREFS